MIKVQLNDLIELTLSKIKDRFGLVFDWIKNWDLNEVTLNSNENDIEDENFVL
jgi:hypothetical protein